MQYDGLEEVLYMCVIVPYRSTHVIVTIFCVLVSSHRMQQRTSVLLSLKHTEGCNTKCTACKADAQSKTAHFNSVDLLTAHLKVCPGQECYRPSHKKVKLTCEMSLKMKPDAQT